MAETRFSATNRSPVSPWPPRRRRSRFWAYVGGFAVLDAVIFALAALSWSGYHAQPGGPTVMPMGTLLSFFVAGILLIGLLMVVLGRVRVQRH